jgi:hypothetical protein
MKIEQQVISIEIAKKLKSLGVRQDSVYYWLYIPEKEIFDSNINRRRVRKESYKLLPWIKNKAVHNEVWAAFNVAELGEMLPAGAPIPHNTRFGKWFKSSELVIKKLPQNCDWHAQFVNPNTGVKSVGFTADTEADARGELLLFLLRNNLVIYKS